MKKIMNKKYILGLITGILISGVTVYAVSTAARDITFKAKNINWKVGNVADALDSLYISKTSDNYSTDEKVVGTWIDGKPIYQKTFLLESIVSSVDVSNLNIDWILYYDAIGSDKNDGSYPRWSINSVSSHEREIYMLDKNTIKIDGSFKWYYEITIRYTKTTDSATTN